MIVGMFKNSFFNMKIENNYKLKTSVFTNKAFEIMKFHKNRIEIMIGNLSKRKDKGSFSSTNLVRNDVYQLMQNQKLQSAEL